jgi:hypothetical protein
VLYEPQPTKAVPPDCCHPLDIVEVPGKKIGLVGVPVTYEVLVEVVPPVAAAVISIDVEAVAPSEDAVIDAVPVLDPTVNTTEYCPEELVVTDELLSVPPLAVSETGWFAYGAPLLVSVPLIVVWLPEPAIRLALPAATVIFVDTNGPDDIVYSTFDVYVDDHEFESVLTVP